MSYVISEMHIKTMRYHHTPIRMTQIWNTDNTNAGKDMEQEELPFIAGGNAKWYSHFGSQFGSKTNIILLCNSSVILLNINLK